MFIPLLTAAYGLIRSCENRARAGSANRGKAAILRIMESTMPYRGLFVSRAFSVGIKRLCQGRELIVDFPRSRPGICGSPRPERGGYRVIKKSATRELCRIIRARRA
jgi:hypothetical protein